MASVDPFVLRIPKSFSNDPEARHWCEYVNQVIHDLWIRTGGSDDAIIEVESEASTTRSKIVALVADLGSQLDDLRSELSTVRSLMNSAIAELKDSAEEKPGRMTASLSAIYEKLDELEARI